MTKCMMAGFLVAAVSLQACGDDSSGGEDAASVADASPPDAPAPDASPPDASPACIVVPPGGTHHQYVASEILMPTTASQANMYGLDLDGDPQGRPDNALGQILSTLASQGGGDLQADMDAAVDGGQILYLFDVDATSLVSSSPADLRLYFGGDCDSPLMPADNFSGSEAFVIEEGSPLDSLASGPIVGGALDLGPGTLTVEILWTGGIPLTVRLEGARVVGAITEAGIVNGRIGGAIRDGDVDTMVLPALAAGLQMTIDSECFGSAPDCCPGGSTGQTLLDLFDENSDCMLAAAELKNNSLISSLLAPDVDLFDSGNGNVFAPRTDGIKDSLSVGMAFTAVGAAFELP